MPNTLTFQQWFNDILHRKPGLTKHQYKHEALKVQWSEIDGAEAISLWIDWKLLRAMKKARADGMPMAGWSAAVGADGSRHIMRPETWLFEDWQYNILLRMKGTKRDFVRADKIYNYGVSSFPDQVSQQDWPRPLEDPHFYWNLPELDELGR